MSSDWTQNQSARDAEHPKGAPPDPPADIGKEIHLDAPPAAGIGDGDPPYEPVAPWPIAVQRQHVEQGLTRGPPHSPDPLPNPLIPPRLTDPDLNYETVRNAGSGTHGKVDIVKNKELSNKQFALKTMDVNDERRMLLARREATIMKRLDHKNICRLYSAQIYAGTSVLLLLEPCVMSLYEYIRLILKRMTGDLEEEKLAEIKRIATGLLKGVAYMHGEGVLHRDFKTQNILLKKNGGLKITDFGLVRKIEKKPTDGRRRHYTEQVGTFSTMAPEVLGGNSDYGFETDMWSIGCVIGEMFIGRPVFQPIADKICALNAIMHLCGDFRFSPPVDPGLKTTGNTRHVREFFQSLGVTDPDAFTLLSRGLKRHPRDRFPAERMLRMKFFTNKNPVAVFSMRDTVNYPFLKPGYTWPEDE